MFGKKHNYYDGVLLYKRWQREQNSDHAYARDWADLTDSERQEWARLEDLENASS